ncbi:acyltransferase family protein [Brachybacterium huguangmaarense]
MTDGAPQPRGRRRGTPLYPEEEMRRLEARRAAQQEAARHHAAVVAAEATQVATADPPPYTDADEWLAEPVDDLHVWLSEPMEPIESEAADAATGATTTRVFRPEIQGLRAVAILMVVCYHIWFDRVSGGVDIFLLISAFLLTGSFVRKIESGRPLAVPQYWAHAFKRLAAPAAVVVAATVAAVVLLYPENRRAGLSLDAVASATWWENWLLAARGVDYFAADRDVVSPFQHFWSLSIQGQVFLLWPLLFLLAAIPVRRRGWGVRRVLVPGFTLILAASLAWSVHLTATDQTFAYFDTRTRLWEFALGSLLALLLPSVERHRGAGDERPSRGWAAASWIGVAAILACGFVVDVRGAFPGWIALWPLLAASLVIAAGSTGTRWGVDRLLASRPLQRLGDISYALYLVHWPILVTVLLVLDVPRLGIGAGSAVVAASIVLGWLLTRGVDDPVRRWPWASARTLRSVLVVAVALGVALAPALSLRVWTQRPAEATGHAPYIGAAALEPGADTPEVPVGDEPFLPRLDQLEKEWVWFESRCSLPVAVGVPCDQMLPEDAAPTARIVAYGNSHTQQFLGVLTPLAQEEGWQIERPTIGGCDYRLDEGSEECRTWNARIRTLLAADPPDAIVMRSTLVTPDGIEQPMPGYADAAEYALGLGIDVIAARDNPRFAWSVPECIDENGARSAECAVPRASLYADVDPSPDLPAQESARVYPVDLTDQFCPEGMCRPVIGNVAVYLDDNHVTWAYSRTLTPFAERQLRDEGFPLLTR